MLFDLDIAFYDVQGILMKSTTASAGSLDPIYSSLEHIRMFLKPWQEHCHSPIYRSGFDMARSFEDWMDEDVKLVSIVETHFHQSKLLESAQNVLGELMEQSQPRVLANH